MAHTTNSQSNGATAERHTLRDLPKSKVFTSNLPTDAALPTPLDSHNAPRLTLGPRMVKEALFTYVRPDPQTENELLAVSPRALQDLGIKDSEAETDEFKDVVAGKKILTWDESKPDEGIYPWAQCYGGYQFGQWAGQLGDGRAISLFESTNPSTGARYEVQLKGAGRTPYSRFADGRAVLRSSIREFVVSEYLNAIGIPSTRALALTVNDGIKIRRERLEPGAIVTRFAQSWIRFGTFDLQRIRGDRKTLRTLADYTAEHVYGGWDKLPSALPTDGDTKPTHSNVSNGIPKDDIQGSGLDEQNRYTRLYRAITRANALTVAKWQAYGFMNGVLNTDNTSILGLSVDFGPFAFLDTFDPAYTPNHDDHQLRYSYRNQPTIIWWNLVRLGEALGELMGAGARVDDPVFVEKGVTEDQAPELVKRAENMIDATGEEYKAVFLAEYKRLMTARLGLKTQQESDFESLMSELLDCLEAFELDFHHAFRRLSSVALSDVETEEQRRDVAGRFFKNGEAPRQEDESRVRIGKWLGAWVARVRQDWGEGQDEERVAAMKSVNPNFVPRSWILDELIDRVEKQGERKILPQIMQLTLAPFKDSWDMGEESEESKKGKGGKSITAEEAERFTGDVPKYKELMQCSCSS
ncbi:UPF0061-domain-containing protein [Plenodomus tracheiphilus IPT5]|uniref:Selenoprotein O n=1 Tax=Plenodomus tracheiphilus IPT5 TaxID=1408161 RepID=A0A6A7APW8_9PLEO|nr:UPF0061-domain-containing protein [Plenodomus tracheiphilus IPT5]